MGAQSLVSQGYGGYQGWGDAEADADFRATGGAGKKTNSGGAGVSGGYSVPDPIEQAKKIREFNIESNKPVVQSLEASKTPLQDRYKSLIEQIKGNQKVAENRQTVTTSNELGRRGIQGGGLYDQEFTNALNPVTQQYTGMISEANSGMNIDLSNIDQRIAALQAGNPDSAISSALSYVGLQSQAQQRAAEIAAQQARDAEASRQFNLQYDLSKNQSSNASNNYTNLGEGQTLFNLLTGKPVYTAPKTYKADSSGSGW